MGTARRFASRVAFIVSGLVLGAAGWAHGQPGQQQVTTSNPFDVQLFQQAIGKRPFLTLDSAMVPAHLQWGMSLASNFQRGPFSIYSVSPDAGIGNKTVEVVQNQFTTELAGFVGLVDRFQLALAIPISSVSGHDYTNTGMAGRDLSGAGIGDIRFEAKAKVASFSIGDVAVIPGLTAPTGDNAKFLGEKNFTGRVKAVGEFHFDSFRGAALLGLNFRQASQSFSASVGSQVMYGLAGEFEATRDVAIVGELIGRHPLSSSEGTDENGAKKTSRFWVDANPVEADAGIRLGLPKMLSVTFGAGAGVVKGIGSPKFRAFLALAWAPDFRDRDGDGIYDAEDRCPDQREDKDGFRDTDGCPEPDNDGDGLLDAQDKCPNVAEDLDQFQDEDGCPELDNDKDGIPDLNDPCPNAAEDGRGKRPKDGCPSSNEDGDGDGVVDSKDKCPDDPEDRDGFQDYDGCPEPDNDEDGIPDGFDACPNEAEDADGFEDTDGCPDPDNDKDGVEDKADKCPTQAETLNGNQDDDGCPDPGQEIVRLTDTKIEVRERIGFGPAGGKSGVSAGGMGVVKLIAQALRGHAEIAHARVDVYTDGVAKEETQNRAEAIVKALTGLGIDAARLKGQGMGGGGTRVEIVIEGRAGPKIPAPVTPAKE